nr:MAG: RNA-dependent RNA polymerase [Leptosphaeria biglobosa narnavirus 10]
MSNHESSDSCVAPGLVEQLENELLLLGESVVLTDTAILMGDPGCKGVLTLHNLVAEEEAALEEVLGHEVTLEDLEKPNPIVLPWRHFSCAGDDHTAIGPDSYLDNIGKNHQKNQMVLSEGKHVRSRLGGFYCERVILKTKETVFVSQQRVDYNQHALVDSIKVRLLSTETKDREAEVETNPAIGKAKLLYKQLLWSPPGWERTLNVIVQRRFMGRMRKYLPRDRHGNISRQIELPPELGGIGMSPPIFDGWDFENVLAELTPPHLRLIQHALKGMPLDAYAQRVLGKFSSDRYARGVPLDDVVDVLIDRLFDLTPSKKESELLKEARIKFKLRESTGYRIVSKYIGKLGYETKFSLKRKLARAVNQEFLLVGRADRGFKTATWESRKNSYEADLLLANFTNEVDEQYDLQFIYETVKSCRNSEALKRKLRTQTLYMDPTAEIWTEDGPVNVLKDLKQNAPDTKLPPTKGFV